MCFETLVFEWPDIKERARRSTHAEALKGHSEIVARFETMASEGVAQRVLHESPV
jgi:hypothetical protein